MLSRQLLAKHRAKTVPEHLFRIPTGNNNTKKQLVESVRLHAEKIYSERLAITIN